MRYFRVTLNPADPYVIGGPGGDSVLLRLPVRLPPQGFVGEQMYYAEFRDGGYLKVPDDEMGNAGPALDTVTLGLDAPLSPYPMFQESALPLGAVDADIPLWSTQLQPLVEPPAAMPPATVWPVLSVVGQPG